MTDQQKPDAGAPPRPGRFAGAKGAIAVGARGVVGLLAVAVAATAIAAATVITGPLYTVEPPSEQVAPVPAAQQRVCPGPLLRLGDDTGQGASVATSVGAPDVAFQSSPEGATAGSLDASDDTAGTLPQLLELAPTEAGSGEPPALAGSQSQQVDSGDLVGLAAAQCAEGSGDAWLVGGATDVGRTTLITLSNPSTVIATVDLAIFGESGEIVAPGTDGIVVEPRSQRILSLASFAPGTVSPVVNVRSRGGLVVANLQQSIVRTLAPGGVEIIGATSGPARQSVIPGVVIAGEEAVAAAQAEPGFSDLATVLRAFVPGEEPATATVTVVPDGASDEAESTTFEIELDAGEATDVPLAGLVDGSYTVEVASDVPVVSGVRTSVVQEGGASDFSWLAGASALADTALVSIAPGPRPTVHLANPTEDDADVTIEIGDREIEVVVPAGRAVATGLPSDGNARLTGVEGLVATVSYLGGGQVSAFGVTPPGPGSRDITVYR